MVVLCLRGGGGTHGGHVSSCKRSPGELVPIMY